MPDRSIAQCGTFAPGRATAAPGTPIVQLVPPYGGFVPLGPLRVNLRDNFATPLSGGCPHVTSLVLLAGATPHTAWVLRPRNFTYFVAALPVNTTLIPNAALAGDPGVYSTNYQYPTPGGIPPGQVADNAIAAGDYVAYQLADGSWQADKIASGTFGASLTLATGTPNRTGGSVLTGTPFFFFGVAGDVDPANGQADFGYDTIVSTRNVFQDPIAGIAQALHPGDPLLFFDANATNADVLDVLSGYYEKAG